jgi:serine kinase of HPr protein (carbohydrate metabolism regulator)
LQYAGPVETLVHATCVALGGACALLRGDCGAGKSDLALRFLFLPADALGARPALIADDRVVLQREGGRIVASCPAAIAGKIEVRGLGIARLPALAVAASAELTLAVDFAHWQESPRFPESGEFETILGLPIRRIALDPSEPSAPVKLALALQNLFETLGD